MLKKVSKQLLCYYFIDDLLQIIKIIYQLCCHYLSAKYILQIDNFYYCKKQKNYIINLKFRNKGCILTINIKEALTEKMLLHLLSPVDSYIIGIIHGLYTHKIIYDKDGHVLLDFLRNNNDSYIISPMILISERSLKGQNQDIILKPKYCNTMIKTSWQDISKKPYLIQGLNTTDAINLGIISINFLMDNL